MAKQKLVNHKHYTASEVTAQEALSELNRAGFLATTAHTDSRAASTPLDTAWLKVLMFTHPDGSNTSVVLEKQADDPNRWRATRAAVRIGNKHYEIRRHRTPIPYWAPYEETAPPEIENSRYLVPVPLEG